MIARFRRDSKIRWFILNNNHTDKHAMSPRSHIINDNWEPRKACGSIEGAIDRFEQALKRGFAYLQITKSSNLTMVQKKQPKIHQKLEEFNDFIVKKWSLW